MFGKAIKNIKTDLDNGLKLRSFTKIISKSEFKNLQNYANALKEGTITEEQFNVALKKSSTSAQIMGLEIIKLKNKLTSGEIGVDEYNASVNRMTIAQTAAGVSSKIMGAAIKTALNVGITLVIDAIVTGISSLINKQNQVNEIARESAKELEDNVSAIDEYIGKISKLQKELNNENTTTERANEVRNELYDIQKDLIENYGIEKEKIDLTTQSIEEQINALNNLKTESKEAFKEVYQLNASGYDNAWKEMTKSQKLLLDSRGYKNNGLAYYDSSVKSQILEWYKEAGFYNFDAKTRGVTNAYALDRLALNADYKTLDSTLESIQDKIQIIKDELSHNPNNGKTIQENAKLISDYTQIYEYLSDVRRDFTQKNIELYDTEFEQMIKYHSDYSDSYYKLYLAQKNYESRIANAMEDEAEEIKNEWVQTYNDVVGTIENTEIKDVAAYNWFVEQFGSVANESEKIADTTIKNLNPVKEKLNELNTQLEALKETTDSAFSNQSTLQSAFDKIQEGSSLSADEVRKLVEICPELATEFDKTVDGYTISSNSLIQANANMLESTKESVQEQVNGYQEIIDKYEEYQEKIKNINNAKGMPSKEKQLAIDNLYIGISEEEYQDAIKEVNKWKLVLEMLGITLEDTYDDALKYTQTLNKMLGSLDTANSLLSNWTDTDQWKKEFSDVVDAIVETFPNDSRIKRAAQDWFRTQTKDSAQILVNEYRWAYNTDLNNFNEYQYNKLGDDESAWEDFIKKNTEFVDEFKTAYGIDLANIATYKKAREELLKANDFDPFSAEAKAFNEGALKEFDEATAYFRKLFKPFSPETKGSSTDLVKKQFDTFMKEYEKLHDRGLMSDEDYYNKLEEANELYYKNCEDHLDDYISNETKIYNARKEKYKSDTKEMVDNLKDQYDAGKIALEDYAKALSDLSSSRYGEGSTYFGTEFATDALKENFKDAFDAIIDAAKDSLSKMLITPDKYLDLINEWGKKLEITDGVLEKAKEVLSESDYLDAWDLANGYDSKNNKDYELRAKRVAYIYDLAEKLYGKDGQNNVKAYNELIKQGLEEEKSIWEDRVNDEKSFWEDRQEELETYYDTQIDKIKDVQDEESKLKDLEEKRLAVIEKENNLEKIRNQKSQLIFEDGTYRYDINQDDLLSAEEELADAIEALRDEELNTQIELLEEQKNNAVEFYEQIINKIDEYLDKENKILNSDTEVLNTVLGTDTTTKAGNFDVQKFIDGGSTFESFVNAYGGIFTKAAADFFKDSFNSNLVGKQIAPSIVDKVVNNSNNTTNNNATKVINVGGITVKLELTVQSLEDFVGNKIAEAMDLFGNALEQEMPRIWAKA